MTTDLHFTIKEDKIYLLREMPVEPVNQKMVDATYAQIMVDYEINLQKVIDNAVLVSNQDEVLTLLYDYHYRPNVNISPLSLEEWKVRDVIYTLTGYKVEIKDKCGVYGMDSDCVECRSVCENNEELAVISPIEPEENKTMNTYIFFEPGKHLEPEFEINATDHEDAWYKAFNVHGPQVNDLHYTKKVEPSFNNELPYSKKSPDVLIREEMSEDKPDFESIAQTVSLDWFIACKERDELKAKVSDLESQLNEVKLAAVIQRDIAIDRLNDRDAQLLFYAVTVLPAKDAELELMQSQLVKAKELLKESSKPNICNDTFLAQEIESFLSDKS